MSPSYHQPAISVPSLKRYGQYFCQKKVSLNEGNSDKYYLHKIVLNQLPNFKITGGCGMMDFHRIF
jgi:hypothetical protein